MPLVGAYEKLFRESCNNVNERGDTIMRTKPFVIGILGLLLAFSLVLGACKQPTEGGDNNTGNQNNTPTPTPTTGTLVISNTTPELFIQKVEVRESGEAEVLQKYTGAPVGRGETVQFTLEAGVYDITLTDDWNPGSYYKTGVVIKIGQTTNLTFNGLSILSN
jgi:hypothetical protein